MALFGPGRNRAIDPSYPTEMPQVFRRTFLVTPAGGGLFVKDFDPHAFAVAFGKFAVENLPPWIKPPPRKNTE